MAQRSKRTEQLWAMNAEAFTKTQLESDVREFRSLLGHVLPGLKQYIVRRLSMAQSTGAIYSSDLNAKEILDAVYVELFERFNKRPQDPEKLETFIYRIVDEILDKELDEKEYEKKIFVNLNRLVSREVLDLEEKFTMDAEGELIMTDELDDISYHHNLFELSSVFLEGNETLSTVEEALKEYDKQFVHQEIRKQLMKFPERERTVFDMFWLEEMDIDQIAQIRNLTVTEAEDILKKVTLKLKEELERKFQINSGKGA